MQHLSYLHFFSSLVYLYLAIFVLFKNYKALISSGYANNGEVEKVIKEGALGFLQKPFEINELSKAISKVMK